MDHRKELKKKLSECYERLMKQWMASTPAKLVADAEEIAAATFIHNSLVDAITEGDAEVLLRLDDPLAVLQSKWIEENGSGMAHGDDLLHCIWSITSEMLNESEPITVKEFLLQNPTSSFELETPGGCVWLKPEEAKALLAGGEVKGYPGVFTPSLAMPISAEELLPQLIGGMHLESGVWILGTYMPPEQSMTMEIEGVSM